MDHRPPATSGPGSLPARAARREPSRRRLPATSAILGLVGTMIAAFPVVAQEGQAGSRSCTLRLQPTDATEARRIETGPETYITHVWGGLVWTCGDARMEADSAVKYDLDARLEMIGSVDYRDSIRTLTSRELEYFQREDRIVARGDVFLTRLASESTLEAPRVEFFRAMGPGPQRTLATGRAHMVFHTDTVPPRDGPPVVVDADEAEFLGEREVRAWGDVQITRPDLEATADSAVFRREEGTGELFGSPEARSEGFTLAGERLRTLFEEGEVDRVEAVGDARASGESFELFAPRIVARVSEEEVEEIWAFGEGRVAALSETYRLGGDSIRFAFVDGAIDSLQSVGEATALQVGDDPPDDPRAEPVLDVEGSRSWVTGDTVTLSFEPVDGDGSPPTGAPDSAATDRDTTSDSVGATAPGAAADTSSRARLRSMRAIGSARAYYVVPSESAGTADLTGGARDYMLGREIVVHFRDGEVDRVEGTQAIGIHLDPVEGEGTGGAAGADTTPTDTTAAPDSVAPSDTTAVPDTVAPPDTTTRQRPIVENSRPWRDRREGNRDG